MRDEVANSLSEDPDAVHTHLQCLTLPIQCTYSFIIEHLLLFEEHHPDCYLSNMISETFRGGGHFPSTSL